MMSKAGSMLLMAFQKKHLWTFNQYKGCKILLLLYKTRFGGNDATKKTQKTLLKQMIIFTSTIDLFNLWFKEVPYSLSLKGYGQDCIVLDFVKHLIKKKPVRKPVKYAKMYRSQTPRGNQRNWNNQKSQQLGTARRNMTPRAVLMKTGLKAVNTARPVNTAHPKTTVYSARLMSFNTAKEKVYTAKPKAVNTARPTSAVVNAVRANQATRPISQTSWNLIEDMLPLGEEPDEEELLVKELLKLSSLLKVPGKNNMYSVDMKNIIPKESLTCLVAKATLDESMLWHRRLGHVNFKTINKLVKDNLVRGFPSKCFEIDQTCVACLKGKQHKASCKFDGKSDDGLFVGYSLNSKAFREVDINKKTENQAKMTKLSMEWKRLCKIKAKDQKSQSQSQSRRISSQTGAGTEEYYWMQS
ncbi:putative ribonuclease H-like domain-containing protein [Tanacetum coccineum]